MVVSGVENTEQGVKTSALTANRSYLPSLTAPASMRVETSLLEFFRVNDFTPSQISVQGNMFLPHNPKYTDKYYKPDGSPREDYFSNGNFAFRNKREARNCAYRELEYATQLRNKYELFVYEKTKKVIELVDGINPSGEFAEELIRLSNELGEISNIAQEFAERISSAENNLSPRRESISREERLYFYGREIQSLVFGVRADRYEKAFVYLRKGTLLVEGEVDSVALSKKFERISKLVIDIIDKLRNTYKSLDISNVRTLKKIENLKESIGSASEEAVATTEKSREAKKVLLEELDKICELINFDCETEKHPNPYEAIKLIESARKDLKKMEEYIEGTQELEKLDFNFNKFIGRLKLFSSFDNPYRLLIFGKQSGSNTSIIKSVPAITNPYFQKVVNALFQEIILASKGDYKLSINDFKKDLKRLKESLASFMDKYNKFIEKLRFARELEKAQSRPDELETTHKIDIVKDLSPELTKQLTELLAWRVTN